MGHYRSEMGFEEEDRKRAEERERRLTASAKKIEAAIKERGLPRVLAEMIADPTMFAIQFR